MTQYDVVKKLRTVYFFWYRSIWLEKVQLGCGEVMDQRMEIREDEIIELREVVIGVDLFRFVFVFI